MKSNLGFLINENQIHKSKPIAEERKVEFNQDQSKKTDMFKSSKDIIDMNKVQKNPEIKIKTELIIGKINILEKEKNQSARSVPIRKVEDKESKTPFKEAIKVNLPINKSETFEVSKYLIYRFTEGEIIGIKEAFDLFDSNGSGLINLDELLSFDCIKHNLFYNGLFEIQKNGLKDLSFDKFIETLDLNINCPHIEGTRLYSNFKFEIMCDKNTGKITFDRLKNIAKELGENLSDEELIEIIKRSDLDGDGQIDSDEFYAIMCRNTKNK